MSTAEATIAALLDRRANDDTIGLIVGDRRWTWREMIDESECWARALLTLRRTDRPFHIGVMMGNDPEYLFTLLGAARAARGYETLPLRAG